MLSTKVVLINNFPWAPFFFVLFIVCFQKIFSSLIQFDQINASQERFDTEIRK